MVTSNKKFFVWGNYFIRLKILKLRDKMKRFLLFPIITTIVVSGVCANEVLSKDEIVKKVKDLNSDDRKKVLKMIRSLNTKTKIFCSCYNSSKHIIIP